MIQIDARGIHYRELNQQIRQAIADGYRKINLINVNGQRYIGDALNNKDVEIYINGVPGQDLCAFMDGPAVWVNGNAQDGVANTMSSGKVIIKGMAGDVLGYGMRGGRMYIQGDAGYRIGIHMKSFKDNIPTIVVGGRAGDFFGEYMAGGRLILLGMNIGDKPIVGNYVGTGMHGGSIFIRGAIKDYQLGKEVGIRDLDEEDWKNLQEIIGDYANVLELNYDEIMSQPFIKLLPVSHRPYGNLYAY
jgi:glutamate synthase domain-containing protein 3